MNRNAISFDMGILIPVDYSVLLMLIVNNSHRGRQFLKHAAKGVYIYACNVYAHQAHEEGRI